MPTLPYGWWPSPLTAEAAAASRTAPSSPLSDGQWLYWLESRPEQQGRVVILWARRGDVPREVTPDGVSVRSRVHEYGGGAYCLLDGERLACVDSGDQRIRVAASDGSGEALAVSPVRPEGERWHHGDLYADRAGGVLAVRERQMDGAVTRDIVRYDASALGEPVVMVAGRDFYAAARPSPDGAALAYVTWDHPDMSWDSSELWVAATGAPTATHVAGGAGVSVGQPTWGADGALYFVSDEDGWWQPHRWRQGDGAPVRLSDRAAEFHGPDWALGQQTMVEVAPGTLLGRYRTDGLDHLALLREGRPLEEVPQPCPTVGAVVAHDGGVVCLGRTVGAPATLWWAPVHGDSVGTFMPFVDPVPSPVAPGSVSSPEPFRCAEPGGRPVYGLYFPARLDGTGGPPGDLPPLVVFCHGGPTGSTEGGFDVVVQFFTTRGFAVAAVDYAGSSGHGRAYRRSLDGAWGEADADDCVAAALHLAREGVVDGRRMAIRGSSAGGFTALNALVRSTCFAGAASWYGVTDLLALEATTHDFESRYNHRLVGPLPETEDRYRRRSPVNRVDDMTGAVLLLYGTDDLVVPADQARSMAAALRRRGLDCEEHAFEGEGHGFRRADTVRQCLEAELAFYRRTVVGA